MLRLSSCEASSDDTSKSASEYLRCRRVKDITSLYSQLARVSSAAQLFMQNISQSYAASPAIWDHPPPNAGKRATP